MKTLFDCSISSQVLHVIDFEATSLDRKSYPIEIGIATLRRTATEYSVWSALIKPDPSWEMVDGWDPDAERIHQIKPRDLRNGITAAEVIRQLNGIIGESGRAWVGDEKYDVLWFAALCDAALPARPSFTVAGLSRLTHENPELERAIAANLAKTAAPHRAGPDAARLLLAVTAAQPDRDAPN